jgi:uncharacterized membrane protein YphA (DoxX/SURF4 family)
MTGSGAIGELLQALSCQIAAFLALLFIASAAHKWTRWQHTQAVAREFAGVPRAAAPWAAAAAGAGEALAGVLLLVPAWRAGGALLGASILGAYLALIVRAIVRERRDVDCGCGFGSSRRILGAFEVGRNAALVIFALLVALPAPGGAKAAAATQILAACALLALYIALDQVMGLQPMREGRVL